MANEVALVTANEVSIVESTIQTNAIALEAITPGAPVREDPSTGKYRNGNATDATEGNIYGIATGKKPILAGTAFTAVRIGVLDGYALTASSYGDAIYLSDTDARLSTVAGTVSQVVGKVITATANRLGDAHDKLLQVEIGVLGPRGATGPTGPTA